MMIGIVGGMGPWATADLLDKIAQETIADVDQDHVPVLVMSRPAEVDDRTTFMMGNGTINPGVQVARQVDELIRCGATVVGMPCNTLHLPRIFKHVEEAARDVRLVSIVASAVKSITERYPQGTRVGLLATAATMTFGLYDEPLKEAGFRVVQLDEAGCAKVHAEGLYGDFGIKRTPGTVSDAALGVIFGAARELEALGADVIALACTELPIVLEHTDHALVPGVPFLDPTRALARSLVDAFAPSKLKAPLPHKMESPPNG